MPGADESARRRKRTAGSGDDEELMGASDDSDGEEAHPADLSEEEKNILSYIDRCTRKLARAQEKSLDEQFSRFATAIDQRVERQLGQHRTEQDKRFMSSPQAWDTWRRKHSYSTARFPS